MDSQLLLDAISRFLHVATAITLVGGTVFMRFVLKPAADQLTPETHDQLRSFLIPRWKRFVHAGIAFFLLSGFYNYIRLMPSHKGDGLWHALVGTKILIAFVVFFLASALVGKSAAFEGLRKKRPMWLAVIVVLAMIIVGISSFVKVRGSKIPLVPANIAVPE